MPNVLYIVRYVRARPSIAFLLSSEPQARSGTDTTRLCIKAIGNALEFMNMAAAMTKLLLMSSEVHQRKKERADLYLWDRLKPNTHPSKRPTAMEAVVTITNQIGITHSSFNFSEYNVSSTSVINLRGWS